MTPGALADVRRDRRVTGSRSSNRINSRGGGGRGCLNNRNDRRRNHLNRGSRNNRRSDRINNRSGRGHRSLHRGLGDRRGHSGLNRSRRSLHRGHRGRNGRNLNHRSGRNRLSHRSDRRNRNLSNRSRNNRSRGSRGHKSLQAGNSLIQASEIQRHRRRNSLQLCNLVSNSNLNSHQGVSVSSDFILIGNDNSLRV